MGIDRDIFDAAGRPDESSIPDGHVDEAVTETIRGLREKDPEPAPPAPPQPRQPTGPDPLDGIEDRSNSGLLRALLDERDRRQGMASQLERYQAQERERAKQEGRAPLNERLFTHPQETLEELRNEWTAPLVQQLQELRVNQNFGMAHMRHGENFESAWNAWYEQVRDGKDARTYFEVMNSPNPGEALVEWHNRGQVLKETGGDLSAYKQRIIDEYLASQGAGGRARAPNGQFVARPQAPQPPTSISRMGTTSPPEDDPDLNDGSDAAIFAAARPQRRKR